MPSEAALTAQAILLQIPCMCQLQSLHTWLTAAALPEIRLCARVTAHAAEAQPAAAVMPKEQVAQLGAGQALMHLASDAVRAASTSPFLEASSQVHGLPVAILCSLSLPVSCAHSGPYELSCRLSLVQLMTWPCLSMCWAAAVSSLAAGWPVQADSRLLGFRLAGNVILAAFEASHCAGTIGAIRVCRMLLICG